MFSLFRWDQQALNLDFLLACLLSCFKVGKCWRSHGRPFSSCQASFSSSSCAASCHGLTILLTSLVSLAACFSPLPSCLMSPSGLLTNIENASSSLCRCWPTSAYSLPSSFGFIFTLLIGTGLNTSPASPSQARSAKSTT